MKTAEGLVVGEDHKIRCFWVGKDPLYQKYHDNEWGIPAYDDTKLFEKICLEGFQAGLSWITVLKKRENFRESFDHFDYHKIAVYNDVKIAELMQNKAIIRHQAKIVSTINNAQRALVLIEEIGSLAQYFWSFKPSFEERPEKIDFATLKQNPITPASIRLSKDLKKRGWTFVGPTTCYAFMQAMGMVNDHIEGCFCQSLCEISQ